VRGTVSELSRPTRRGGISDGRPTIDAERGLGCARNFASICFVAMSLTTLLLTLALLHRQQVGDVLLGCVGDHGGDPFFAK